MRCPCVRARSLLLLPRRRGEPVFAFLDNYALRNTHCGPSARINDALPRSVLSWKVRGAKRPGKLVGSEGGGEASVFRKNRYIFILDIVVISLHRFCVRIFSPGIIRDSCSVLLEGERNRISRTIWKKMSTISGNFFSDTINERTCSWGSIDRTQAGP